jgi:FAD/FMN-containing dehydrogenase
VGLRAGPDGFFHPASESDLVALVHTARARRVQLRVRGSAHSVPAAIYSDSRLRGRAGAIDVMLDRYTGVSFDDARMQVTVEAGCHLGDDPRDPTRLASWDVSLLAQLERRGWALPDLGGVTHQTVSGYVLTGSCGGTIIHAFEDALVAIRCIDGTGRTHTLRRDVEPEFDAVACSFGLLGIVSTLTFACIRSFHILGRESVTSEDDCAIDLFGAGPTGLEAFLRTTEYSRLMWWPRAGVRRIVVWQARRMREDDYGEATGSPTSFRPKRYAAMGELSNSLRVNRGAGELAQWVGGKFFDVIEGVRTIGPARRQPGAGLVERRLVPAVLGAFVPVDTNGPQIFWDTWSRGLPMDNQMSESSLPTTFTEIFVPLAATASIMQRLRDHFVDGGLAATGMFIFELYAARASRQWLHPAYARDSLRVDVFWFERNRGDRERFFQQFWQLLVPFDYRLHWAKHLPSDPAHGADYLRPRYPRWAEFLALRSVMDPDGLFLSSYWRRALGITQ